MSEQKHIISIRMDTNDRTAIRAISQRLFVRESALYRLAVNHLLKHLDLLLEDDLDGSDLLPVLLTFREELCSQLNLKKLQLYRILNDRSPSDKHVSMADIELLLLPEQQIRKRLQHLGYPIASTLKINEGLESYFCKRYNLSTEKNLLTADFIVSKKV